MKKLFKKKFDFKKLDKQDKALLSTIALLVVLVIVLAAIALNLKNNEQNKKANIVIPILEEQTQNEISVDLSEMKKGDTKEYIFKVSNYKLSDVNEEKINYDIEISTSENVSIELYKGDSDKNLLSGEDYVIENNKLPKNKKTEDIYRLIIKATNSLTTTDKITLKINS